jgi:hypothetical protein
MPRVAAFAATLGFMPQPRWGKKLFFFFSLTAMPYRVKATEWIVGWVEHSVTHHSSLETLVFLLVPGCAQYSCITTKQMKFNE